MTCEDPAVDNYQAPLHQKVTSNGTTLVNTCNKRFHSAFTFQREDNLEIGPYIGLLKLMEV